MPKLKVINRYATTPNELLNNGAISLKAKGLFAFIQSKPDNWAFSAQRIAKQTKDGKSSIVGGLKELEENGFLVRTAIKTKGGKWNGYDYILSDKPSTDNRSTDKRSTENYTTLSKKDNSKKDIVKKNKIILHSKTSFAGSDLNSLLELFKPINPSYERLYSNTTQRGALERLVKKYSVKKIKEILKALPKLVVKPFCPQISTPYQLETKLGNLISFYNQSQNKQPKITKL